MTITTQHETFCNNPNISALVNAQLEDDSRYHPNLGGVTRGGMANHYPMTVTAMGASDEQVVRFIKSWPRQRALIDDHLHLEDNHELNDGNWVNYLGQANKLREFRRVFLSQLAEQSQQQVISSALTRMQFGLPMGLFHPLIRLSFAQMHGDNGLIADALAYMAIRYFNLYPGYQATHQDSNAIDMTAREVWRSISQQFASQGVSTMLPNFPAGGSLSICERLCGDSKVHRLVTADGFSVIADNLNKRVIQLCQSAVQLYLYEPSLTTLHAVTACQALADLTRSTHDTGLESKVAADLWQLMWVWLTALYIEKGFPTELTEVNDVSEELLSAPSWQQLFDRALDTQEVHVMKMAFSCKWLYDEIDANPLYRLAVAKMLGIA